MGSYGEAQKRVYGYITDFRGRGRYKGAIYQGREGRRLVVIQAHFPDAEYAKTEQRCGSCSFELGAKAASAPPPPPP